jgi:hypothetical protein
MKEKGIRFGLYAVTSLSGEKTRVHYRVNNRGDGRECVTVYARDYSGDLSFLSNCKNNSDIMTDYFEKDRAVIFKGEPLYEAALKAVTQIYSRQNLRRINHALAI